MTALIFLTFSHILSSKFSWPYHMAFCSLSPQWLSFCFILTAWCMCCSIYILGHLFQFAPHFFFLNCQQHSCNRYISNLSSYDLPHYISDKSKSSWKIPLWIFTSARVCHFAASFTLQIFIDLVIKLGSSTSLSWQEQVFLEDITLDFYLC